MIFYRKKYVPNVHEVVWIKYGGDIVFPHYSQKYVPYYSYLLEINHKNRENIF